jgi:hypothetical protein
MTSRKISIDLTDSNVLKEMISLSVAMSRCVWLECVLCIIGGVVIFFAYVSWLVKCQSRLIKCELQNERRITMTSPPSSETTASGPTYGGYTRFELELEVLSGHSPHSTPASLLPGPLMSRVDFSFLVCASSRQPILLEPSRIAKAAAGP